MMSRFLAGLSASAVLLCGCQQFTTPSSDPALRLVYPDGAVADLPHRSPGTMVPLSVEVRSHRGQPVKGVTIVWEDGQIVPALQPRYAVSDSAGLATTRWILPALAPDQFSTLRTVRAYLPGAENSPIVYRIEVIACTRC